MSVVVRVQIVHSGSTVCSCNVSCCYIGRAVLLFIISGIIKYFVSSSLKAYCITLSNLLGVNDNLFEITRKSSLHMFFATGIATWISVFITSTSSLSVYWQVSVFSRCLHIFFERSNFSSVFCATATSWWMFESEWSRTWTAEVRVAQPMVARFCSDKTDFRIHSQQYGKLQWHKRYKSNKCCIVTIV